MKNLKASHCTAPATLASVSIIAVAPSAFEQIAPILLGFGLMAFASVLKTWIGLRAHDRERLRR